MYQLIVINHLRETRIESGLSIRKLAEISNISASDISAIERGKYLPNIFTVLVLSDALNVEVKTLFELKKLYY